MSLNKLLLCLIVLALFAPAHAWIYLARAPRPGFKKPAKAAAKGKDKFAEQVEKRKAGVNALKALAQIYRERNAVSDEPPARAASIPPPEAAPPPPPAEPGFVDDAAGLLGTFASLAAAKVELAVLRQRDSIVSSVVGAVDSAKAAPTIASQKAAEAAAKAAAEAQAAPAKASAAIKQSVDTTVAKAKAVPTELAQTTAAKLGAAQARVEAELAEAKRGLGMD